MAVGWRHWRWTRGRVGVRGYCGCRLETLEVNQREGGSERVLRLSAGDTGGQPEGGWE